MRVLVVEDEARVASLLRRSLTDEGYAVDVAANGPDAIWRAGETTYDAIVLDLMLPGADGFAVCRSLRQRECWAPILMLTARTDVRDRIRGLDAGADDYLTKPFSLDEVAARLRALLRRGAIERPTQLRVDTLRLDPGTRQVWRGEVEIELTAREFGLLELLMRQHGQVLSRTRLLEGNWDLPPDASSNVVDQYVAYLRKKIDRPFGVEQLETVLRAGYRLRSVAQPVAAR
jgi:two-component system OmpR family response regulator